MTGGTTPSRSWLGLMSVCGDESFAHEVEQASSEEDIDLSRCALMLDEKLATLRDVENADDIAGLNFIPQFDDL